MKYLLLLTLLAIGCANGNPKPVIEKSESDKLVPHSDGNVDVVTGVGGQHYHTCLPSVGGCANDQACDVMYFDERPPDPARFVQTDTECYWVLDPKERP